MSEHEYINLLRNVVNVGEERHGRNGTTRSTFGERIEFPLSNGQSFPLLTTKRVFWRGVVEELLWFLRGSTNAKELQDKNIHIWDKNTTREFLDQVNLPTVPEGDIGAGYGYQWRCFGGDYPSRTNGVDQVKYMLDELTNNPHGRRAVLSAWNPKQLHMAALPPCHFTYQFYISDRDGLSCQMQMRSCDVCAGLPFNIASTALLTCLLAHVLHVKAHKIVIITGDTHVYAEHIENAHIQMEREPLPGPKLTIVKGAPQKGSTVTELLKWLEDLCFEDIVLDEYACHPPLKYEMIA